MIQIINHSISNLKIRAKNYFCFFGKFNFVWWSFLFFFLKHLSQWSKVKQWKIFVIQDVKRLSGKQFLRTAWFSKNFSFQAILLVQIEWQPFFIFHLKSSVKLLRKTVRKCAVRHCVLKKSNWEIPKRHTAEKNIKKWKLAKLLESHKKNISRKKFLSSVFGFRKRKADFPHGEERKFSRAKTIIQVLNFRPITTHFAISLKPFFC